MDERHHVPVPLGGSVTEAGRRPPHAGAHVRAGLRAPDEATAPGASTGCGYELGRAHRDVQQRWAWEIRPHPVRRGNV